jgi:hypothetical protein
MANVVVNVNFLLNYKGRKMVIGTGKELVSFAERHGAIISQHIWEALTDLDKCAPKAVVEFTPTNTGSPKLLDDMEQFATECDRAGNVRDAKCVRLWIKQLQAGA